MGRQLLTPALFVLATACDTDAPPQRAGVEAHDSAGVRIVRSQGALGENGWRVSKQPRLTIRTEDDGEWVIHWIRGALRLSDDRLVLLSESTKQLLFFDEDGVYQYAASREGDGPGELRRPFVLSGLSGDTLVVTDRRTGGQTWFSGAGEYLKSVSVDRDLLQQALPSSHSAGFARFLAPGFALAEANERGLPDVGRRVRRTKYFVLDDLATDSALALGPFGGMEQFALSQQNGRWAFFANNTVYAAGGAPVWIYIADSGSGEILAYDFTGELKQVMRDAQPAPPITDRDVEWERWELLDWGEQSGRVEEFRLLADAMPIPAQKPAFESIFVDRLGFLWVKEYSSYRPDPVAYRIYDRSGARVGVVSLPGRLTVFDVGTDYVLGVYTDTDYVETILEYELVRP